ncbi:hypothetical protein OGAPHI_002961 [Ogataea philodendri]|uniref:Uncharacterized protein n=1 Tax=Ogataea philodendri TaxID=1378263 RepID=A0A9P8P8M7_9ASCO|nr:uncharacterized protein OGAPHI_002961 [Ogataea philodendri]KAH3667312.1 hypothetical protein OGAPHI_002961 [Ogataea philodendri]
MGVGSPSSLALNLNVIVDEFGVTDIGAVFRTGVFIGVINTPFGGRSSSFGEIAGDDSTDVAESSSTLVFAAESSCWSRSCRFGMSSTTSLMFWLFLRNDCLLFWNQICTAFSVMSTLAAISSRLILLGVLPFSNSDCRIASSAGEVLLLLRLASRALSMSGSEDRNVDTECEMNANDLPSLGGEVNMALPDLCGVTANLWFCCCCGGWWGFIVDVVGVCENIGGGGSTRFPTGVTGEAYNGNELDRL